MKKNLSKSIALILLFFSLVATGQNDSITTNKLYLRGYSTSVGLKIEESSSSSNAGFIRFGDKSGWKLHFGSRKESSTSAQNAGVNGVFMSIVDNGNVGIGTTTPTVKLEVNGAIKAGASSFDNINLGRLGVSTNLFLGGAETGGTGANNVGIGDSVMISTTGSANTAMGRAALQNMTIGTSNVALGRYALNLATTASYNIGIGLNALKKTTISSYNIALGYGSMEYSVTAARNIAIGYMAGRYLNGSTTEVLGYNVAIGWASQQGNVTTPQNNIGVQNTSIGYASLLSNEKGSHNVAVGTNASNGNIEGIGNVAIGSQALMLSKRNNHNVAIGYDSQRYYLGVDTVASSSFNISLGYASLRGNPTLTSNNKGINNIAIGPYTLINNESGSYNTALGYQSLGTSNIIGIRNVAVGMQTGLYSNSNQNTYIGTFSGYGVSTNANTGGSNTGLGYASLYKIQGDATQNVSIGQSSGYEITTGKYNVFIGTNAGRGIDVGTGNTVLGHNMQSLPAALTNTLILGTGNGEKIRALDNGNVGIGTTAPNQKLELAGAGDVGIRLFNTTANTWDIENTTNGVLDFVRGNTNIHMRINQLGQVGIGTTTIPTDYKLAVAGNIITDKIKVKKSTNGVWPDFVFAPTYTLPSLRGCLKFHR
jgi:hypothetical protein